MRAVQGDATVADWKPDAVALQEQQTQQFQKTAAAEGSAPESSRSLTSSGSPWIIATCSAVFE